MKNKLAFPLAGLAMVIASSAAMGAEFTVETTNVLVGTTEGTVGWSFENSPGSNLSDITVDITYDDAVLTPQTSNEEIIPGTGIFVDVPDGCLTGITGVADFACVLTAPGNIRVTLSNQPNALPNLNTGSITFDLSPTFADGDTEDLPMILADQLPAGVPVELNDGGFVFADAPPAILDVDPTSINFGNVRVGESSDESPIAICNDADPGSAPLSITGITVSGAGFSEGAGGNCEDPTFSLDPGECCNFHVVFSPNDEDDFTGSVAIESSAGGETVALTGEGSFTDASLVIDPTSFDFGDLDINADAVCTVFTLSNTPGDDPLTISSASIIGVILLGNGLAPAFEITSNNCTGETLGGGESCQIEVCFDPDEAIPYTGELIVTSDVNDVSADLSGTGTATANPTVNPPSGTTVALSGIAGSTDPVSASPVFGNSGSADASVSCSLTDGAISGDIGVTLVGDTTFDLLAGASGQTPFSIQCDVSNAEAGDSYTGTLSCTDGADFSSTHPISCTAADPQPAIPINTLQPMGLALFALLMLLIGGISIRLFSAS